MDNVTKMFVPNNLCFNDISQSVQLAIFHIRTLDDNLGQGWHHAWLPHNCELSRSFFFVFQMTNHFRAKWVECHFVALKNNFDDADQQASCHASVPAQLLSCGRNVTTHARQGLHLNALWDATFWNRWLDPVTTFVVICLATDQMTWLGCLWCHRCATDAPNIQKDTENAQCWGSFLPASLQDRKMNGGISLDQTTRVAKFALLFFVINWTRNWQGFPCTVPSQAWVNKRPTWNVSWESVSKQTVADDGQLIQTDRCHCLALCLAKHLHTRWSKKHIKAEKNQMQLFLWTLWSLPFQQKFVTSHVIVLKQMPWTKLSAKWIQFAIVLQLSVNPVGIKWAKSTSLNCRIGQNSWHPGNVVCDKLIVSMQKCRCCFCVCEDWHEMHNLAKSQSCHESFTLTFGWNSPGFVEAGKLKESWGVEMKDCGCFQPSWPMQDSLHCIFVVAMLHSQGDIPCACMWAQSNKRKSKHSLTVQSLRLAHNWNCTAPSFRVTSGMNDKVCDPFVTGRAINMSACYNTHAALVHHQRNPLHQAFSTDHICRGKNGNGCAWGEASSVLG